MFLAIKEMKHAKLRYSLIMLMIILISYLIFILTGLAYGLAESNRQAIDSWQAGAVILNSDADSHLSQSVITKKQITDLKAAGKQAQLGELGVTARDHHDHKKISAELLGISKNQFIYRQLAVTRGRKFNGPHEAVVDQSMYDRGYRLGDDIRLSSDSPVYKIVGFTKGAKLSVAPVIYTSLSDWRQMKFGDAGDGQVSAVVLKKDQLDRKAAGLDKLPMEKFINKLPGYSAQNMTFAFMIVFLMLITLIIIAIFLYILTMQKLPYFAVLKAQGISTSYLVKNTVGQAVLITVIGVLIGGGITILTAMALPPAVPITFNYPLLIAAACLLVAMSVIGALIPARTIVKIDPVSMIGGN